VPYFWLIRTTVAGQDDLSLLAEKKKSIDKPVNE
jgi:hypothetical protein